MIVFGICVGGERFLVFDRAILRFFSRRYRTIFEVFECDFIWGNYICVCFIFNGYVINIYLCFYGE